MQELDEFTQAYITCALWSSTADDGKALGPGDGPNEREEMSHGKTADDIVPALLQQMIDDCQSFQSAHWDRIADDLERAGADFWLTRNGHGAGFWDGDWPEDDEDVLTEASKAYGEVWLSLDDDGTVYAI